MAEARPRGGMVKLVPSRGSALTVTINGDPDGAGAIGGWESSERPLRRPARWWKSQPEDTLSLPCLLDLHATGGPSLERRLDVLYAMGQAGDEDEPPIIRLLGDVTPREQRVRWVLQGISRGRRLWTPAGALRRVELTLELEGYDGLDTIKPVQVKRTRTSGKRRARVIRTQAGDTLRAIAVRQLGQSSEWKRIRSWNPRTFKSVDPDAPLRAGIKVTLR
jgi:phage protein U